MFDDAPSDTLIRYRLLWNARRQPAGVHLHLQTTGLAGELGTDWVDLLASFRSAWTRPQPGRPRARHLLLTSDHPQTVRQLLAETPSGVASVAVPERLAQQPAIAQAAQEARLRGLDLIWVGLPGSQPKAAQLAFFDRCLLSLSAEQALATWRALRPSHDTQGCDSAFLPEHLYTDVGSLEVAIHGLDQQGVLALLDWPCEDTLYQHRAHGLSPDSARLLRLLRLLDDDAALEDVEAVFAQDALLSYRLLRYLNSAALGLGRTVGDLHSGLLLLGLNRLRAWLNELRPSASDDPNLRPLLISAALRARLAVQLLAPQGSEPLRREMLLCALLAHIDDLVGEPLPAALKGLALPERTQLALLKNSGPYAPYLQVAQALGQPGADVLALCRQHDLSLRQVNQALLQTLALDA